MVRQGRTLPILSSWGEVMSKIGILSILAVDFWWPLGWCCTALILHHSLQGRQADRFQINQSLQQTGQSAGEMEQFQFGP